MGGGGGVTVDHMEESMAGDAAHMFGHVLVIEGRGAPEVPEYLRTG